METDFNESHQKFFEFVLFLPVCFVHEKYTHKKHKVSALNLLKSDNKANKNQTRSNTLSVNTINIKPTKGGRMRFVIKAWAKQRNNIKEDDCNTKNEFARKSAPLTNCTQISSTAFMCAAVNQSAVTTNIRFHGIFTKCKYFSISTTENKKN